ncbi:MAG TPA: AAA family ATPase [Actinophytocola sp.]|uniref:bifunctional aminoglycoside phosphotransferase/ATP-binding protein n=1 Tax=Actinophytocola sp. TaxID=1872138 RepID=UPI002F9450F8
MERKAPFAAVRETHIGVVLLVGDRAYKLKKPVDLGFLDFSTRERRRAACRREVELNRRLAPDVYLGVAELIDVDGSSSEPLVEMRRMPDDRRLSTLVRSATPPADGVAALARLIAAFHSTAERGPHIDAEGTRDALAGRWEDSFAQVESLSGSPLDPVALGEIARLARAFLAGRDALFRSRVDEGRIVDGHGDLLADDIFLTDAGPRVLDCLEFDDRLRRLDGLDDIAFLAMDLERLGVPKLGELLLDRYREHTADPAPASLRHHYIAYRAFVRVKVACLRHAQGDLAAAGDVVAYADIARRHLRLGQVRLVLVGGLPGSGKTTVAGMLADSLGAVLLSSDRVRKELAGVDPLAHVPAEYRQGIYDPEHTEHTYHELLRRAGELLARGESVVLDASWSHDRLRDRARLLAKQTHSGFFPLRCAVAERVAAQRIRSRTGSLSDADPAIAAALAADTAPWPDAIGIDTSGQPADAVAEALRALGAA